MRAQSMRRAPCGRGAEPRPDFLRGKWSMVYVGDGLCDDRCRKALYLTRQSRIALNKDMDRVQRVFLVTGRCCDRGFLAQEHPDLIVALARPQRTDRGNRKFEGAELPIGNHQPDLLDARAAQGRGVGHGSTAPARLERIDRQPQRHPLPGGRRKGGLVIDAVEAAVGAQVELVAVAVAAHDKFDHVDVRARRR